MAEKEELPFEEKIFRYIYDSLYHPGMLGDKEFNAGNRSAFEDLLAGARSYDEARNMMISELERQKKSGYDWRAFMQDPVYQYNLFYNSDGPDEGIKYTTSLLPNPSKIKKKDIVGKGGDVSGFSQNEIIENADRIAKVLLTDPETLNEIIGLDYGLDSFHTPRDIRGKLEKFLESQFTTEKEKTRIYRELGIKDDEKDYLLDYITGNLERAYNIAQSSKEKNDSPVAHFGKSFVLPNSVRRQEQGFEPDAFDKAMDLASLAAGAGIGKYAVKKASGLSKLAESKDIFYKPALLAGTIGTAANIADNVADSLRTTHTYSEVPGREDSKEGDWVGALTNNIPDYGKEFLANATTAMLASGLTNMNGKIKKTRELLSKGIDFVTGNSKKRKQLVELESQAQQASEKVKNASKSALDALNEENRKLVKSYKDVDNVMQGPGAKNLSKKEKRLNEQFLDNTNRRIINNTVEQALEKAAAEEDLKALERAYNFTIEPLQEKLKTADNVRSGLYYLLASKSLVNPTEDSKFDVRKLLSLQGPSK